MTLQTEIKIQRALNKLFTDLENSQTPTGEFGAMDPSNVCAVIAKSDFGKRLLLRFVNAEVPFQVPVVDYSNNGQVSKAMFSQEYLNKIFAILSYGEKTTFTSKRDYPIMMENEDFKFFLAPRVEDSE